MHIIAFKEVRMSVFDFIEQRKQEKIAFITPFTGDGSSFSDYAAERNNAAIGAGVGMIPGGALAIGGMAGGNSGVTALGLLGMIAGGAAGGYVSSKRTMEQQGEKPYGLNEYLMINQSHNQLPMQGMMMRDMYNKPNSPNNNNKSQ